MNHCMNEEVMWQRLQDLQREGENRRVFAQYTLPRLVRALGRLAGALRRQRRQVALHVIKEDADAASDAA